MTSGPVYQLRERNLGLDLMRVTEAAALAAGRWAGRGDKEAGDKAAVDQMRQMLSTISMRGVIVIGEGEKDEAPMLHNDEEVGDGTGAEWDVAVDPVDGTTLLAKGMPNAVAVIALAERGTMFNPKDVFYMDKIAVGPEAVDAIDIEAPPGVNVRTVARAMGKNPEDITVCILDRPRHSELVRKVRATGARIKFISDGDVAGAIMAARPNIGVDLMMGSGAPRRASSPHAPCAHSAGPSRRSCGSTTMSRSNARSMPGTTSTGCWSPRTWSAPRTCSWSPPASPKESCSTASATRPAAR